MASVFVSYNRSSKEITTALVKDIGALGHTVWFDQELGGGQVWWDQILASVRKCDVSVFVMDLASLDSTACKREYGYAADLGKPVLPVLVADGISTNLLPPALSQIQYVDYRKPDRQAALRLARAFTAVPASRPLPDPLPPPPEVPISYLGRTAEQVDTVSTLSYQQQIELVADLRRSLRDPETAKDGRTLLARLRRRRDLFAAPAEEIDELLGSTKQAQPVPPRAFVPETSPKADTPQHADVPSLPPAPGITDLRKRWLGALIGAGVAAGVAAIADYSIPPRPDAPLAAALVAGIGGGIAGAISRMHRRVTAITLVGVVLGFSMWAFADASKDFGLIRSFILGAPAGAILGAIVGATLRTKKGWT